MATPAPVQRKHHQHPLEVSLRATAARASESGSKVAEDELEEKMRALKIDFLDRKRAAAGKVLVASAEEEDLEEGCGGTGEFRADLESTKVEEEASPARASSFPIDEAALAEMRADRPLSKDEIYYASAQSWLAENRGPLRASRRFIEARIDRMQPVPTYFSISSKILILLYEASRKVKGLNFSNTIIPQAVYFRMYADEYTQEMRVGSPTKSEAQEMRRKAISSTYSLVEALGDSSYTGRIPLSVVIEAKTLTLHYLRLLNDTNMLPFLCTTTKEAYTVSDLESLSSLIDFHFRYITDVYQITNGLFEAIPQVMRMVRPKLSKDDRADLRNACDRVAEAVDILQDHQAKMRSLHTFFTSVCKNRGYSLVNDERKLAQFKVKLVALGEQLNIIRLCFDGCDSPLKRQIAVMERIADENEGSGFGQLQALVVSLKITPSLVLQSGKEIFCYTSAEEFSKWDALVKGPLARDVVEREKHARLEQEKLILELDQTERRKQQKAQRQKAKQAERARLIAEKQALLKAQREAEKARALAAKIAEAEAEAARLQMMRAEEEARIEAARKAEAKARKEAFGHAVNDLDVATVRLIQPFIGLKDPDIELLSKEEIIYRIGVIFDNGLVSKSTPGVERWAASMQGSLGPVSSTTKYTRQGLSELIRLMRLRALKG